ncbi:hypothetical protein COU58_01565 [Candidatus Pacearchaeota archaeon CG10_big_fil_rev_8_21_14_0_10_32_42]|nr:MAG: hypothetical protein COU58_01565 [Candidatus Pacearchaeota archaeon CG10_big_fil_rev_8_21_14_0_10_32_42]
MEKSTKNFLAACSVIIGTCIGAGILGIPYVASQSGFSIAAFYLIFLGGIILLVNLYLGETALRTKQNHQLVGYAKKYIGKGGGKLMKFAFVFGIYSAIIAYLVGVGDSFSFLIFGNLNYSLVFGVIFGLFISFLLWRGIKFLKVYEKMGVLAIVILISTIFFNFVWRVEYSNLDYTNFQYALVPFGVILFALLSETSIPIASRILKNEKHILKKTIIVSSIISIIFYLLFTFTVLGFSGFVTPEIATFTLGAFFIILGVFTMFTSHISLGNALMENFEIDEGFRKKKSWILSSFAPVLVYIFISFFDFFSFTRVLSIGGVVSGGLIAVLSLFIVKKAKIKGERKPEYSIPLNWIVIIFAILVFGIGVVREVLSIFGKA